MNFLDFLDQATAWQWVGIIILTAIIGNALEGIIKINRKP